jgi:prepilin-type N-terminal cleavage/methylation domain-containing protein
MFPMGPVRNGFTYIELTMVLIIVAIIGVLVIKPISYLSQIREVAAARNVKADIRYAQSYALRTQLSTCIFFTPATGIYDLYYESSPGTWTLMTNPLLNGSYTVNITTGNYSGVVLSQTNFNGVNNGLVFDDSGTPYSCNSSCGAITLLSAQGSVTFSGGTTVTVQANTGKVL